MAEETVVDRGDNLPVAAPPPAPEAVEKEVDEKLDELTAKDEAPAEEAAAEDEQPRDSKGKFAKREAPDHVPKSRFDEAVGKERAAREAAEARAAALEERVRQEQKSVDVQKMEEQVEALEKQHTELLLDGEKEKAAAVMKQIRHAEREIARMETAESASRATAQAVEQVRMEAAIAKLEADYPVFNPDSENYDQDIVDIVLGEQQRLMQTQRMVPSAALAKAAEKIMMKLHPPSSDGEKGKGLAAAKNNDRTAEQVAKNLDTAKRQPASMREAGKDSDKAGETKINVGSLTQSEFNALPEATKRKLRGDDV